VVGMIVRRLLGLIPVLLVVSFGVFMLTALVPGDAAVTLAGGENATLERIEEVRAQLGLDDPLVVQYLRWLGDAVRLDFGTSLYGGSLTVWDEISSRLPITFGLAFLALLIGVLIGLPVGIVSAMRPGGVTDRLCLTTTSLGIAVPNFFLAMVLITIFAVRLQWLPAIGFTRFSESPTEWLRSMILPAFSLALFPAASLARQVRAALIDVLQSNYVRTAWASGAGPARVVGKHALKNAAIPAVTVLGLQLSALIGGAVIIEQLFSIPGLGSYMLRALPQSDLPVIQGVTVTFVVIHVALNLLVDISYGFLNPKVRVS
jgi:peptide/nickel transport system permease protein